MEVSRQIGIKLYIFWKRWNAFLNFAAKKEKNNAEKQKQKVVNGLISTISVGKIKSSNILLVKLLPSPASNFQSMCPQVWLFFWLKKCLLTLANLLINRGILSNSQLLTSCPAWKLKFHHSAIHSDSKQPQISTNLPMDTEQTDLKRCDLHLSKQVPSGDHKCCDPT